MYWGTQVEFAIALDLVLMGKVFGTDSGAPGGHTGLCCVTDRGQLDFDLIAGHRSDGKSASSLTLGLMIGC